VNNANAPQERQHDPRNDAHDRPHQNVNNANAHIEQPIQHDDRHERVPSPPPQHRAPHDPLANGNGVPGANDFVEQGRHPRHPPRPRNRNHGNANNDEQPAPQQENHPRNVLRPHQELQHDPPQHHHPESSETESSQHNGDGLNQRRRGRAFPRGANRDTYDDLTNMRFDIPKFFGKSDPEAYFSWVLKVDKIFRVQCFSDKKKVALASMEFEEYALLWWEQLQDARLANHQEPINTWVAMKEAMHKRFVPSHYTRDLYKKLQELKQGLKSGDEYYKEMEISMMRANVNEYEEQSMARFMNGLNYPIKKIVEFQPYASFG